jgi:hypothetical protein
MVASPSNIPARLLVVLLLIITGLRLLVMALPVARALLAIVDT